MWISATDEQFIWAAVAVAVIGKVLRKIWRFLMAFAMKGGGLVCH